MGMMPCAEPLPMQVHDGITETGMPVAAVSAVTPQSMLRK